MGTDAPVNLSNLPEDISVCHELIRQLCESLGISNRKIEQLQHRLDQLLRARYGPSSEKMDESQLRLFVTELMAQQQPEEDEQNQDEPDAPARRRQKHGRKPLPKDLPRNRVVHDLQPHELACPDCGQDRTKIGDEISEQLDYIPASLFVVEHVRCKYACKKCEAHVIIADKPTQPIEKGLAGSGLLAHTIVSKYGDHLPLHRLERIFKRHGLQIPRSTTCGWMAQCADLLVPLYKLMHTRVLESKVLHTDDTPIRVQDRNLDKTRQGRIWIYWGDPDHPYAVFDYTPNRSRDGPVQFLGSFSGYLQADAYTGYDAIYDGLTTTGRVVEVACWAHTRRYYYDSRLTAPAEAHTAMAWIGKLYKVETSAQEQGLAADQLRALRQEQSVPLLESFHDWLEQQQSHVLPKSPMGEAIRYTLSNWDALIRYTTDGDLSIDNNAAERALRGIAVGRGNWLFAGSDRGGKTAAVLFSFIRSCERNEMDPFVYLRDVIARISDHPMSELPELLPDRWKAAHGAAPEPDISPVPA